MGRSVILAGAAALLAGCNTTAPTVSYGIEDNPAYRSKEMNSAYTLLSNPQRFPEPNAENKMPAAPEVKAFRKILAESDSGFVFENLYAQANDTGKLYALSGLYLTNPVGYERARRDLSRQRKAVQVFDGETTSERRINAIVGTRGGQDVVIANGNLPNLLGGDLASSEDVRIQREILAKAHPGAAPSGGYGGTASSSGGGGSVLGELFTFSMPRGRTASEPSQRINYAPSLGDDAAATGGGGVPLAGNFQSTGVPSGQRLRSQPGSGPSATSLTARTADPTAAQLTADAALAKFRSQN